MFPFGKAFILITLLAKYVTSEIPTEPTFHAINCHTDNGVYALNGTYHKNLNTVLSDLTDHSPTSLYYNSSSGGGEDDHETAYAKYYCRGDISTQLCHDCVTSAASFVLDRAPCLGVRSGIVWYKECTLRYENKSNVGVYDNPWGSSATFQIPDELEQTEFDPAVKGLFETLIHKAAYDGDPRAYATGEVNATGNNTETVYCLVQCSPDTKGLLCEDCLTLALADVDDLTGNPTLLRWFYPQCQLRLDLDLFYLPYIPQVTPTSPGDATSEKVVNSNVTRIAAGKSNVARIAVPVAVAVASILLVCAASFGIWYCLCTSRINNSSHIHNQAFRDDIQEDSGIGNVECFKFTAIEEATMKFSLDSILAQGGFGTVYKGILINGQQVAIKRLSRYSSQGIKEFKTEVAVVAKLQHRNLVRLLGFCAEQEERILVYEFLSNLSLDKFLFDSTMSSKLDWETRNKIIKGVACGIRYLHVDSLLTIVHRDLKSSNILLDEQMNPKIADFGMAKLVKIDDTIGNTSRIAGTYGYMAPEYAMIGRFSTKSDIYSFGVIIVEVVSGISVNHFHDADNGFGLLHQAWRNWNANAIERLVDPNLDSNYSRNEVERCIQIGLLCVQGDAAKRPTIRDVVSMLDNPFLQLPSPSAPSSFFHSSDISTVTAHSQGGQSESSISS